MAPPARKRREKWGWLQVSRRDCYRGCVACDAADGSCNRNGPAGSYAGNCGDRTGRHGGEIRVAGGPRCNACDVRRSIASCSCGCELLGYTGASANATARRLYRNRTDAANRNGHGLGPGNGGILI